MREIFRLRQLHCALAFFLCLATKTKVNGNNLFSSRPRLFRLVSSRGGGFLNGGSEFSSVNETTASKGMGDQDRHGDSITAEDGQDGRNHRCGKPAPVTNTVDDPAIVGVKSHSKKSNAVGDPDGDDDDDDDDEEETSDYSEEWEELGEIDGAVDDVMLMEPQVQVEVELVEEEGPEKSATESMGVGGVGVRLGRMSSRRKNRKEWRSPPVTPSSHLSNEEFWLRDAWTPHIYYPPPENALSYLAQHSRLLDGASKSRLDRRTLYGSLLMEWGCSVADKTIGSNGSRKFLPASTSQALQAALSMATQPKWRLSSPRTSGIRLYQEDTKNSLTLAMQETIAMALVSLPCLSDASDAIWNLTFCD